MATCIDYVVTVRESQTCEISEDGVINHIKKHRVNQWEKFLKKKDVVFYVL